MNEETQIIAKSGPEDAKDSKIWNVSVRGWIALILVLAVCFMEAFGRTVEEPLYSLAVMAVGFYFGQVKPQPKP